MTGQIQRCYTAFDQQRKLHDEYRVEKGLTQSIEERLCLFLRHKKKNRLSDINLLQKLADMNAILKELSKKSRIQLLTLNQMWMQQIWEYIISSKEKMY